MSYHVVSCSKLITNQFVAKLCSKYNNIFKFICPSIEKSNFVHRFSFINRFLFENYHYIKLTFIHKKTIFIGLLFFFLIQYIFHYSMFGCRGGEESREAGDGEGSMKPYLDFFFFY
jgi:hypothetical protein